MGSTPAEQEPGTGEGYWFTPVPVYLLDAALDPKSTVNGSAVVLWAHLHRNYAWRHRVFPSYSTLAKETEQSESAVKRQLKALREVGALDWGAQYGPKGRTSNSYALAPRQPFEFDRALGDAVEVKNDPHRPVEVKNDPGVEVISDPHPQVKNDLGIKSTEELKTLSPPERAPAPSAPPDPPGEERETSAARNGKRLTAAQEAIRAAAAVPEADEPAFIAWATAEYQVRGPAWWRTTARDLPEIADRWRAIQAPGQRASPAGGLPPWCGECGDGFPAATNPRFRTRGTELCHCHPDHQKGAA